MKTRKNFRLPANIRILMILMFIAALMVLNPSCSKSNKTVALGTEIAPPPPPPPAPVAESGSDTTYQEVDVMPVFRGGDTAILGYIARNTKYPEPAKLKGTQGKVIVRFAVEADGSVDKVSVMKGVDPELDKEAARVVGTMPAFEKPGIKDGKAVSVWYIIPINFALN